MLGTPFVVIWLVGFIADLDIDSWLIKGLMYAGMWITVQFLSKYVTISCAGLLFSESKVTRRGHPVYREAMLDG